MRWGEGIVGSELGGLPVVGVLVVWLVRPRPFVPVPPHPSPLPRVERGLLAAVLPSRARGLLLDRMWLRARFGCCQVLRRGLRRRFRRPSL